MQGTLRTPFLLRPTLRTTISSSGSLSSTTTGCVGFVVLRLEGPPSVGCADDLRRLGYAVDTNSETLSHRQQGD